MPTPEEQARQKIDQLLEAAGWVVQDRSQLNLGAAWKFYNQIRLNPVKSFLHSRFLREVNA